jgi:hypothetical protein
LDIRKHPLIEALSEIANSLLVVVSTEKLFPWHYFTFLRAACTYLRMSWLLFLNWDCCESFAHIRTCRATSDARVRPTSRGMSWVIEQSEHDALAGSRRIAYWPASFAYQTTGRRWSFAPKYELGVQTALKVELMKTTHYSITDSRTVLYHHARLSVQCHVSGISIVIRVNVGQDSAIGWPNPPLVKKGPRSARRNMKRIRLLPTNDLWTTNAVSAFLQLTPNSERGISYSGDGQGGWESTIGNGLIFAPVHFCML